MIHDRRQDPGRERRLTRRQFLLDARAANLVELVERHERRLVLRFRHTASLEQRAQHDAVIETHDEVLEPESVQHLGDRRQDVRLDERRGRAEGVDVALVELAEPAAAPADPPATRAESGSA